MPAKKARELAKVARSGIPNEVRRRAIAAISRSVRLGHSEAIANLEDLHLDTGGSDEELEEILKGVLDELEEAGYKVNHDDVTALFIKF